MPRDLCFHRHPGFGHRGHATRGMVLPFPPETTSGIEVLSAAHPALTRGGDGSNPSNPTSHALVVQRPRLRTRNAATWVRVPPGALVAGCWCGRTSWRAASHFVHESCSGSVVIAPVVFILPRSRRSLRISVWESLVLRVPRAHEIAGSNPATLTVPLARSCAGTGR